MLAEGQSNKYIAGNLAITEATVKAHITAHPAQADSNAERSGGDPRPTSCCKPASGREINGLDEDA